MESLVSVSTILISAMKAYLSQILLLVFIDEESCIGCSQCATIAPDSFTMLQDTGRARAFLQRRSVEVGHAVLVRTSEEM